MIQLKMSLHNTASNSLHPDKDVLKQYNYVCISFWPIFTRFILFLNEASATQMIFCRSQVCHFSGGSTTW